MEEGPSFPLGYSLRVYHHHCLRLRHVLFVIVLACFFSTFLSFVKQVSLMDHSPYRSLTFGRHGRYHTFSNTDTRFAPNKKGRACFFFRMAPILDGERARQLAITLLGAKDGGRHHQERASALTRLRRQIRCCALATTMSWFYELIDRQLAPETVAQAQRRLVRRKLVNTTARS